MKQTNSDNDDNINEIMDLSLLELSKGKKKLTLIILISVIEKPPRSLFLSRKNIKTPTKQRKKKKD